MKSSKTSIKQWAEDDRPREKFILKGRSSLSDAELLAIILGSGSRNESAVELARRILDSASSSLVELGKYNLSELQSFKGIGEAKSIAIAAALEIGRRRRSQEINVKNKIASSNDAFELLHAELSDLNTEEFWIILMNRANKVIKKIRISSGGISGTVADLRVIFKAAIDNLASAIILAHNHPSGNLKPSQADINLTKKIKDSGNILDIPVLDHIIIAENSYFSFADEGLL
ncbi:MAG: DNA repair protein RadC [Salibacteraceae bacterium]|nr:DNA repair protein RadC [Salibacteraceae bacterium]|tara:strand:- start:27497 stop:28189 length:693 start_codon:yes stop_codon:yes gene_type:complete